MPWKKPIRGPIVEGVFTVRWVADGTTSVKKLKKPKPKGDLSYSNAIACQALITGSEGSLGEPGEKPAQSDLITTREFAEILGCEPCYIGSLVRRELVWDEPLSLHMPKPMEFKQGKSQLYVRKEVEAFAPLYEEYREQFRKYKGGNYVRSKS